MLRAFRSALLLRRLVRELAGIRQALDVQAAAFVRIAERVAPEPRADRETVKADTGVSYLDPIDAGLALDFVEKFRASTGHTPDEEEILIYLADEKTTDLHRRLTEREEQLARLQESRR